MGCFRKSCAWGSNSSDGNRVNLLGVVIGTSGTKRVPLGPINILLGNIHFRDLSSVVTHFWEKRKSLDRSYFLSFVELLYFMPAKNLS